MMNWMRLTTRPQTLSNFSIVDMEPGHKRKQEKHMNKEVRVLREKRNIEL